MYDGTSRFILLVFPTTSRPAPSVTDCSRASVSHAMATERQIAANRRNAQLSTGPRSVEGKAASSRNALKTGLYCNGIIIGKESTQQLEDLEAAYTAEYAPATPTERALVDSLIHYEWLLRRYRWLETEVWRATLDRMTDYQRRESWTGNAFMDQPAISRIHRLRNSTQRMFHETLAQLRELQADRQPIEDTVTDSEIGFVPSESEESRPSPEAAQSPAPDPRPLVPFSEAAPQSPATGPQPPSSTLSLQTYDRIDHGTL